MPPPCAVALAAHARRASRGSPNPTPTPNPNPTPTLHRDRRQRPESVALVGPGLGRRIVARLPKGPRPWAGSGVPGRKATLSMCPAVTLRRMLARDIAGLATRGGAVMGGSIYNFGLQLGTAHAFVGKEEWYRRAAETGDTEAMRFLGDLLGEEGETAAQEAWYRRAAEAGDPAGMRALGTLLETQGHNSEAEDWHRKASLTQKSDGQR
jgi:hypothetical protein